MREILESKDGVELETADNIHIELDVCCSGGNVFREEVSLIVPKDKEIDTKGVISRAKKAFLDNYKEDKEFRSKYAPHVTPGEQVELTIISWIRQPEYRK
jgi:hypothetical protein